ncbi:MAG: M23 family metallopeptidase [Acidimicrobiia bacterium]|nr:M23 family metallopeptidase [Acidimicrobiia bacterium]
MRVLFVLPIALAVALLQPADPRAPSGFVCVAGHRPPVTAPITDPFRPPPEPWLAGNRGLEYGTTPGDPVWASHDGVVVFAGSIGPHRYVTVDHGCGLRTTYSFLADVVVAQGHTVGRGQLVGHAGEVRFHFGARLDGNYIDPELLFSHRLVRVVRLVA